MRDRGEGRTDSLPPTGKGLPHKRLGMEWAPGAREVQGAAEPAGAAPLRCVCTCLGPFSWPHVGLTAYCLLSAWPAQARLPTLQVVWPSAPWASLPSSRRCDLAAVAVATWCSGGPPAARWAVSGPSCTAAWRARCCGPGNSPSGRRGTAGRRRCRGGLNSWPKVGGHSQTRPRPHHLPPALPQAP